MGCHGPIHDQFILRVSPDLSWHAACLKVSGDTRDHYNHLYNNLQCHECQMFLDENHTCFVREGRTYCRKVSRNNFCNFKSLKLCHFQDYVRLFGHKCDKCQLPFSKDDYVMRAQKKIFHLQAQTISSQQPLVALYSGLICIE